MGMLNAETEVTALFAIVTSVITTSFYLLSESDQEEGNRGKHWVWGGEGVEHFKRKQLVMVLTNVPMEHGLLLLMWHAAKFATVTAHRL